MADDTPATIDPTPLPDPVPDPTPAPAAADDHAHPVREAARFKTLDVLRGFALLGILGPNIIAFSWPSPIMYDHGMIADVMAMMAGGGATPEVHAHANEVAEDVVMTFFFGKMMFLFSLLFGAGVIMYGRKFEGGKLTDGWWLWYRRMGWLLAIGLTHAVVFWFGDILVWYAACGLGAVWWLRRLNWKLQLGLGAGVYLLGVVLMTGLMALWIWSMQQAGQGNEMASGPDMMLQAVQQELNAYTGTYLDMLKHRVVQLAMMYFFLLPLGFFWLCSGIMVFGMGLTKGGILTGERKTGFYIIAAVLGLTVGLGGTFLVRQQLANVEFGGMLFQGFGQLVGIPTSLGYAATLIALVKLGVLRPVTAGLAAIGRMALTNYLLQTLICTTLFYQHGLGWYGTVQYPELWWIVFSVWGVNLVVSLVWLRLFRFGPAEWLWRSLTYWELQPMRRAPAGPVSG